MLKIYMRLLGFARPIQKYAIPYFFYSLLYALFNSLTFLLIMPILKTMFDADYTFVYVEKLPPLAFNQEYLTALFNYTYSHLFNEYNPENVLLMLAVVTIFVSLLSNLFRYLGSWTVENMRTRTLQRMRNEMFSKVVDMHVGFFSDQRKGDIISKITSDVGVVQFCITNTLQVSFREPFLIIGYTVMMVAISWELALFSVLFLPVVALIIGSIVKRLRHPARTSQQRMGELVSTLDESLSGIKVIKSYNAVDYIKQKFYDLNADLARLTLSMARRQQLASPMSEFLGISAVGVILVFGGSLVFKGSLSPEGFIAFVAMFSQITRPVRTFIDQFANINQGIAAGERIFSIIDAQSEIQDKPSALELNGLKDKIEFRDIHFSYDGSREVIDGISFDIKRGETVALVGPSGGGKSTLAKLIMGVERATSGQILLDGKPVDRKARKKLCERVGIVFQNADDQIIASTVAAEVSFGPMNLRLPRDEVARRVDHALDYMELQAFRARPPHDLSGGEKKRVSIADILAMQSEILLFDEPAASLDPAGEERLGRVLARLSEEGRTLLISTHDMDFAFRWATRAVVFGAGRILADGTPQAVLADADVLRRAHLRRPLLMEVWDTLRARDLVPPDAACPRSPNALARLLDEK